MKNAKYLISLGLLLFFQDFAFAQSKNAEVFTKCAHLFQTNLKHGLTSDFIKKRFANDKIKPCDTLAIISVARAQGAYAQAEVASKLNFKTELTANQICQALDKGYRKHVEGLRGDYLQLIEAELKK